MHRTDSLIHAHYHERFTIGAISGSLIESAKRKDPVLSRVVADATTLQVKLSSGFGTSAATDQMITLRLKGHGDSEFIGEFEICGARF